MTWLIVAVLAVCAGTVLWKFGGAVSSVPTPDIGTTLARLDPAARARIKAQARSGAKIEAIKALRTELKVDLLTAKTAVEQLARE